MVGSIDPRCETVRGTHWPKPGRVVVWSSRRGNHLGQRSRPTASTGRTYGCKRSDQTVKKLLCHGGRPHMGPCVRRDDHDFRFSEIHLDGGVETVILSRCPVLLEGRFAIVKDVGRDAVDALALLTNGARGGRRSRVVLMPRRWHQAREAMISRATGARKPGPRLFDSHISKLQRGAVFDTEKGFEAKPHDLWTGLSIVGGPSS